MEISIGTDEQGRAAITEGLSRLLAGTYILYLKTRNFHWSVTGPVFNTLHLVFEGQYTELAIAVDDITECIRALGFPVPSTYAAYARLSPIREGEGVSEVKEMIRQLVQGQEAMVRTAHSIFPLLDKAGDEPIVDLFTQRMQVHERTAWILHSLLTNWSLTAR